jgi:hypothetical protein
MSCSDLTARPPRPQPDPPSHWTDPSRLGRLSSLVVGIRWRRRWRYGGKVWWSCRRCEEGGGGAAALSSSGLVWVVAWQRGGYGAASSAGRAEGGGPKGGARGTSSRRQGRVGWCQRRSHCQLRITATGDVVLAAIGRALYLSCDRSRDRALQLQSYYPFTLPFSSIHLTPLAPEQQRWVPSRSFGSGRTEGTLDLDTIRPHLRPCLLLFYEFAHLPPTPRRDYLAVRGLNHETIRAVCGSSGLKS